MTEIGFFGVPSEDIVFYLAGFYNLMGKEVAVFDENGSYSRCPYPILRSREEMLAHKEEFDVVLSLIGFDSSLMGKCERNVTIVDRQPQNARKAAETLLFKKSEKNILVIRDTVLQEYDDFYIKKILDFEGDAFSVPFSEIDLRNRCSLQDGKAIYLKALSGPMKTMIIELFGELTGAAKKEIIGLLRKEKRNIWENLLHFSHPTQE